MLPWKPKENISYNTKRKKNVYLSSNHVLSRTRRDKKDNQIAAVHHNRRWDHESPTNPNASRHVTTQSQTKTNQQETLFWLQA